jgi:hypothetical protein
MSEDQLRSEYERLRAREQELEARMRELEEEATCLGAENERLREQLAEAESQLQALKRELFGPKAEKLTKQQREQLEQLSQDLKDQAARPAALSVEVLEPAPEPTHPAEKKKRAARPRHPLPENLETETIILEPEQTTCPHCGREMDCIDEEVSDEIDVVPARLFPQVARGTLGNYVETAIVLVNPQPRPLRIELDSFGIDLPEDLVTLEALGTREILFSGPEFQVGWVSLRCEQAVSATAHILTREGGHASGRLLSQLAVLGQPLSSRFVMPVFFNLPNLDDTGIALALHSSGRLRLTLRDVPGETVAVRNFSVSREDVEAGADITGHFAAFLSEIFDLPPDFGGGSLTVEQILPEGLPAGFSALAVYSGGAGLHTSPTTAVDRPGIYSVALGESSDAGERIQELASQHQQSRTRRFPDYSR